MACHYHPERESTDTCAICGKEICKECGLEIAGKIYCKDCLQKIVGMGVDDDAEKTPVQESEENIYAPDETVTKEYQGAIEDSPYNIKDSINYSGGLESSYLAEEEQIPQVTQEDSKKEAIEQVVADPDDFIYPDHSYEPEPTSARMELEDKYEKYLDDLYFDEAEIPLDEQLAKDEEKYGSLTKKPYTPKETPAEDQKIAAELEEPAKDQKLKLSSENKMKKEKIETPEEMEARIRAEILKEQGIEPEEKLVPDKNENIHNLNYQDEKEPMGIVDIVLTIILVIVILIVIYYLIYLFILHNTYPTFMDALYGLKNPQNIVNNVLSHK